MTDMDMPLPEPDFKLMWRNGEYKVSRGGIDYADCYSADQVRAIVAAEVAKERERMMPLIDEAILDAAGAALAGAGYDGDAIEKIAPIVLEMWRGFKSAAAIRAAAPPQCTSAPSEPQ